MSKRAKWKGRKITVTLLQRLAGCRSGFTGFARCFPRGAILNEANLRTASLAGLELEGFAYLLSRKTFRQFRKAGDRLWRKHEAILKPLRDEYLVARAQALWELLE